MKLACVRFFTLASALSLVAPAWAADYTEDKTTWNGLGYLAETAKEAKVELQFTETLEWRDVKPADNLLLLYPTRALPVRDILRFVMDGGDLIVADDYGSSKELLKALRMERTQPNLEEHGTYHEGRTAFPVFDVEGDHFLFYNVHSITTNHPMAIQGDGDPVLSYGGGKKHLVLENKIGAGRVLVIGDASVFLNDMLRRVYGNKQFAANVLRVFCDTEPCKITLLGPRSAFEGAYRSHGDRAGQMAELFDTAGARVNEALGEFQSLLATWPGNTLLLWGLVLAILFGVAAAFGHGRLPHLSPHRSLSQPALGADDMLVLGHTRAQKESDFGDFARHLIAEVDVALLAKRSPATDGNAEGRDLNQALLRIEDERASLQQAIPPVISAERFMRIHHDTQIILKRLARMRWS
jgi:hypothetical protein